ncbi:hypothetical protein [Bosea caraganae]|uniref:hypothetical protein n=1 Tax=Bosea caraganae TaxID=2763117 RepID=UPI0011C05D19|nr:hypothetical protein [Bosea caraganae]
MSDDPELFASNCLFARKFDAMVGEDVLGLIDADPRLGRLPAAPPARPCVSSHQDLMRSVASAS